MKEKRKDPKKITKKLQGRSGFNLPMTRFLPFPISYMVIPPSG